MSINKKRAFFDKGLLLVFSFFFLVQSGFKEQMVIFVLVSFFLSLFSLWLRQTKYAFLSFLLVLFLSIRWSEFSYFLPVMVYDILIEENHHLLLFVGGVLALFFLLNQQNAVTTNYFLFFLCFFSGYLSYQRLQEQKVQKNYQKLEVESLETTFFLEIQNEELIQQQETKIALEISNEQNRIARDIHDNVGHLLSSSLLQLGAIRTLNQDELLENSLNLLQATMNEGMNNIRDSVHNLHEESLSLTSAIEKMLQHFTFCQVTLSGEISESISKDYKIAYLMIVKESLANVMRHTNATEVTIDFQTYPGFYKLTVTDNGTTSKQQNFNELGMGITGMKERMEKLGGNLICDQTNACFSIRGILPK